MNWRCFHCDEVFDNVDDAALHFGPKIYSQPSCRVNAEQLRELEHLVDRYMDEDGDMHRAMAAMQSRHNNEIRTAEETGYARGLRDGLANES